MSSRRNQTNGGGGSASPFIKRDKFKKSYLKSRLLAQQRNNGSIKVKKEDPEVVAARESKLLQTDLNNSNTNMNNVNIKKESNNSVSHDDEYSEFPLRATTKEKLENMRTHLLKFQSKKKIDFEESFHPPIRLHRKDTRNLQFQLTRAEIVERQKEIAKYKEKQENVEISTENSTHNNNTQNKSTNNIINKTNNGPILGITNPNIKEEPVKEENGTNISMITKLEEAGISEEPEKVGMVKYDGKETTDFENEFGTTDPFADIAPDGGGRARRNNMRRKTRQLKVLDENAKKLRFEEFYPWVMEDYDGYNTWVGSYEAGNSDSYVLFCVEDDGSFTMIPADKVYKFTARNKYATLTIEEAEKRMDKKSGEVPRWLMKHLDDIGTTTTRYDRTKRKLQSVANNNSIAAAVGGGEEEEEHDDNSEIELDFDEEFADDEEAPIIDGNEQENKESEQRIKREMLQANAMGLRDDEEVPDGGEDDLFNDKKIDVEGERIKKALQKTELAALYSDDDEINPYLSESDLENEQDDKKDDTENKDKSASPSKSNTNSSPVKRESSTSLKIDFNIKVKSIKDCIVILKADQKILNNFPRGEWNPGSSIKRQRENDEFSQTEKSLSPTPVIKTEEGSPSKKIKLEDGGANNVSSNNNIPLITEQDIINAIGTGKVNVKEFGKSIRKKFPGPENKRLMFSIVKKLCKKVDNEYMELKK